MSYLPPTLDAKALAALLYKRESTIIRDVTRRPHTLPPFIRQGKKPIWITSLVVDWLLTRVSEPIEVDPRSVFAARVAAPPLPSLAGMLVAANNSQRGKK